MAALAPGRHERYAQELEDLAQSLDAGVDLELALNAPGGIPGASMVEKIHRHGPALSDLDRRILATAERAGELPRALRERADSHRFRAETTRLLIRQLSYPMFVIALAAAVILLQSALGMFDGAGILILGILALLALTGLLVWQYLRRIPHDPRRDGSLVPGLRSLLQDRGELPYLDALHGLYAAGIPIVEAHQESTKICPVAWLRLRFARASEQLSRGENLSDALAAEAALCPESQSMLTKGELSGNLEDAISRAAILRRQVLRRKVTRIAKATGSGLYICAVLVVFMIAIRFYGAYSTLFSG